MVRYNLHFKNVPSGTSDEELNQFFGKFGEIRSLKQMRSSPTSTSGEEPAPQGEPLGFGFVCYASVESAMRARIECRTQTFKSTLLTVNQFEPKASRLAHLEEQRDKRRLEFHKQLVQSHVP